MLRRGHALALFALIPSAAMASDPPRAAVAVCGMSAEGEAASTLSLAIRNALGGRHDVELIASSDEAYLFLSPRPKRARSRSDLALAKKHLKQASSSFAAFELADAMKGINKGKQALAAWVGLREALDLDRERLQLAVAIAHAERNQHHLKEALREYVTRFPNEPPPAGLWPPDLVNRAKTTAGQVPTVLNVRAEPRGVVYIDGREVGTSPVRLGALVEGEHTVEVVLADHFPFDARVTTTAGRESTLEAKLLPDLSSRLKRLKIGRPLPDAAIQAIRRLTEARGLKILFLAGLLPDGRLALQRIDLSAKDPAAPSQIVEADNSPEGARIAVAQLFEPRLVLEPSQGPRVPTWAWIGAGTGVAAVGTGIVLRMMAVSTHREFDLRQGALTQTDAFGLRDRASGQATGGAALLGIGIAALAGIAGWVAFDQPSRPGS